MVVVKSKLYLKYKNALRDRAAKWMIMKILMCIVFTSFSTHLAAVNTEETIEVDNEPFAFILPFEFKVRIPVLHV